MCRCMLGFDLVCSGCSEKYPLLDDVPVLLTGEPRASSLRSHARLQTLTDAALPRMEPIVRDADRGTWFQYGRQVAKDGPALARRALKRGQKTPAVVKRKYEAIERDYYQASRDLRPFMIDGKLRSANGFAFRQRLVDHITAMVERIQPSNVLEVGCGEGINLWLLQDKIVDRSCKLAGFDYAFRSVRLARRHLQAKVEIFNGDARNIPLPDRSVDLAFTVHCLEQIPYDVDLAVREIARVAKEIVFIEPFGECQRGFGTLHHLSHDYARHLRARIRAAGCTEVEFRCLGLGSPVNRAGSLWCRSDLVS